MGESTEDWEGLRYKTIVRAVGEALEIDEEKLEAYLSETPDGRMNRVVALLSATPTSIDAGDPLLEDREIRTKEEFEARGSQLEDSPAGDVNQTVDVIVDMVREKVDYERESFESVLRSDISDLIHRTADEEASEVTLHAEAEALADHLVDGEEYEAVLLIPGEWEKCHPKPGERVGDMVFEEPRREHARILTYLFEEQVLADTLDQEYPDMPVKGGLMNIAYSYTWARLSFTVCSPGELEEALERHLELPAAAIRLAGGALSPTSPIGVILHADNEVGRVLGAPRRPIAGGVSIPDENAELWLHLKNVISQGEPTNLETVIINSLKFWLSASKAKRQDLKFLLTIASLEALVLADDKRTGVTAAFAERTALLANVDDDSRRQLFKDLKKEYAKRSSIVHGSEREDVEPEWIHRVYRHTLERFLLLREEYTHFQHSGQGTRDVLDHIADQKFQTSASESPIHKD